MGPTDPMSSEEVWDLQPADYDDRDGWDKYYRAYGESGLHLEGMRLMIDMMPLMNHKDTIVSYGRRFWFPGCGVSLVPHVFAAWGGEVFATDFSSAAIEVAKTVAADPRAAEVLPIEKFPPNKWFLILDVHDFRDYVKFLIHP